MGDCGSLVGENFVFDVSDCQQVLHSPNHVAHIGKVSTGELTVDDVASLHLDTKHRFLCMQNHTVNNIENKVQSIQNLVMVLVSGKCMTKLINMV